jgi:hypothetical protein
VLNVEEGQGFHRKEKKIAKSKKYLAIRLAAATGRPFTGW